MSCGSKKRIGIAIGVAFTVLVLLLSGTASAERIDIPADYATIQSGLDHARPGDTIYVHAGTYHVDVVVTDRDGREMRLEDATTFVILKRTHYSLAGQG